MKKSNFRERGGGPAGVSIRRAGPGDHQAITALLRSLDLGYPAMDFSCFWVAESENALVGTAELKEGDGWSLLSCVGVPEELQGQGIGRALVDTVCGQALWPVYLYTLVPDFFRKAGFRDPFSLPAGLPARTIYGCSDCSPLFCRCLVRHRDAS